MNSQAEYAYSTIEEIKENPTEALQYVNGLVAKCVKAGLELTGVSVGENEEGIVCTVSFREYLGGPRVG